MHLCAMEVLVKTSYSVKIQYQDPHDKMLDSLNYPSLKACFLFVLSAVAYWNIPNILDIPFDFALFTTSRFDVLLLGTQFIRAYLGYS